MPPGTQLYPVYNVTNRTLAQFDPTPERTHESSQFPVWNWLRGRLFDLGFYGYRRFAWIEENGGFFESRLIRNANSLIVAEGRKRRARAISLTGTHLRDHLSTLERTHINVSGEFAIKRRPYAGQQSHERATFRVVGVLVTNTDDYHLYVKNLRMSSRRCRLRRCMTCVERWRWYSVSSSRGTGWIPSRRAMQRL